MYNFGRKKELQQNYRKRKEKENEVHALQLRITMAENAIPDYQAKIDELKSRLLLRKE